MGHHKIIAILLILSVVIVGCGGGEKKTLVLKPNPIPEQYVGLSIESLVSKSGGISYQDVVGHTTEGVYKGGNDPAITENIEKQIGVLFSSTGMIEKAFPSSEEGVFTFWFCRLTGTEADGKFNAQSRTGQDCLDPLFLLYDLERGPELKQGDIVTIVGNIVGSRKKTGTTPDGGSGSGGSASGRTIFITPSISVIQAKQHTE